MISQEQYAAQLSAQVQGIRYADEQNNQMKGETYAERLREIKT